MLCMDNAVQYGKGVGAIGTGLSLLCTPHVYDYVGPYISGQKWKEK